MTGRLGWALVAVLTGCAGLGARRPYLSEEALAFDASRHREAKAVVLFRKDFTELDREQGLTRYGRHVAALLLKEGAEGLAEVKVSYRGKGDRVRIQARMRPPGGQWEELPASAVLVDAQGSSERDRNAQVLRFPNARPGTLLEYVYEVETDGYVYADEQETVGEHPVATYEFELSVPRELVIETKEYNSTYPIDIRKENKAWRMSCAIRDIPARTEYPFAPHWSFREPRWEWRALAWHFKAQTVELYPDWGHRLSKLSLVKPAAKLLDGYTPRKAPERCGTDVVCRARAVWDAVRQDLSVREGDDVLQLSPLAEVHRAQEASGAERALALLVGLKASGVVAHAALASRRNTVQFDPDFPSTFGLNLALVAIPVADGPPLFVDAACSACEVGEVRPAVAGVLAVVVPEAPEEGPHPFQLLKVEGRQAAVWEFQGLHRLEVSEDGQASDTVRLRWENAPGVARDAATSGDSEAREYLQNALAPPDDVTDVSAVRCQGNSCQGGVTGRYRRLAIPEGDLLVVPLVVLDKGVERELPGKPGEGPLHFTVSGRWREEVEVVVPSGFRLAQSPLEARSTTEHHRVQLRVEPTAQGARVVREVAIRPAEVRAEDVGREVLEARLALEAPHRVLVFRRGGQPKP